MARIHVIYDPKAMIENNLPSEWVAKHNIIMAMMDTADELTIAARDKLIHDLVKLVVDQMVDVR